MSDPSKLEQKDQSDQNRSPDQRTQLGQHQDKQAHQEQHKRDEVQNPDKQGQETANPGRDRYASGQKNYETTNAGTEKTSERQAGGSFTGRRGGKQSPAYARIYSEIEMLREDLRKLMEDISDLTAEQAERLYQNIRDNGPDAIRERVRDQPVSTSVLAFLVGVVLANILRR
jgi:hypothetical protein